MVERVCGIPREDFLAGGRRADENSGREPRRRRLRVGWTQHSNGVQIIRAAAILQLLLGNIGRPGGGIIALRGHASIQGSTDIPTLSTCCPATCHAARREEEDPRRLRRVGRRRRAAAGRTSQVMVSLLKAYYGDARLPENDFGFAAPAEITRNHSHFPTMLGRRGSRRAVRDGSEPGGRRAARGLQRKALARSAGWSCATWRRSRRRPSGATRRRSRRRAAHGGHRDRGLPHARREPRRKGGHSPTRSGCCSGAKRRSIRRATRARSCGSSTTCQARAGALRDSTVERDWPIRNLRWDYPDMAPRREPYAEDV